MAEWITLARPYAKAAFDYAVAEQQSNQNALADWSRQLNLAAAVIGNDKVVKVIEAPALTSQQQANALIEVLGTELGDKPGNFLRTLAANKRLPLLPEIAALFDQFKAQQENSVDVEVASAFPLGSDIADRLANALRVKLQRDIKLSTVVDKSLLGGVVVRSGDVVIDGSVRGRLEKLAKAMNS
jgi:F-type H+-transporting ATPase subunit delta